METLSAHIVRAVFEQLIDEGHSIIDKYCADEITEREGRERFRMLEHIIIRLDYEEQEAEIRSLIEQYAEKLRDLENRLLTMDMKKRQFLRTLPRSV